MSVSAQSRRLPVILVVDDEPLLRMLATEHFEEAGYEVLEAGSGEQAVALLGERPDIRAVFTDVQMPGAPDGLSLAHHVRRVCPGCAIVVVSGRASPGPDELATGARFIGKPYRGDMVVGLFQELLAA